MTCQDVRTLLPLYLYGELDFHQEEEFDRHIDACSGCARALEAERVLHATLDGGHLAPPPALLASSRARLFGEIRASELARPTGLLDRLRAAFSAPLWKPAAALALAAVGFLGGRAVSPSAPAAPVTASRVRFLEADGRGNVNIVLEETRERKLSGALSDDGIRQLVLAASREQGDPGLRVESMDLLRRDSSATEVRRALVAALVSDPNPGVRIKALEGLKQHAADPEVRRALSQVLLRDDNSGLRAQAIDLLVQHKNRDMVDMLQQLVRSDSNDYVQLRTRRILAEMNASADAF